MLNNFRLLAPLLLLTAGALPGQETMDRSNAEKTIPWKLRALEPGHCAIAEVYWNTVSNKLRRCIAPNVWADVVTADASGNVVVGGTVLPASLPVSVLAYGAIGNGVANDTAGIAAACAAAKAANKGLYLPAGTYLTDPITCMTQAGMTLSGEGWGSILKSRTGATVIEITAASPTDITFRNFAIDGNAGASGHGIYVHDNSIQPWGLSIDNVKISNVGGRCVFMTLDYQTRLTDVSCQSNGGNGIELDNRVADVLTRVYVHGVGAGKAGFVFYSGTPALIACNGLDSVTGANSDWGVFGQTVAEDGVLNISRPVFIGSNIEHFGRYGIRFKQSSMGSFLGTSFNVDQPGVQAIRYESPDDSSYRVGIFDGSSYINCNTGCTYANSVSIHASRLTAPLVFENGTDVPSVYVEDVPYTIPAMQSGWKQAAYGIFSPWWSLAYVTRLQTTRALSDVKVVTFSATPTFDLSLGDTQKMTLTANVTSESFTNKVDGQTVKILLCQDSTGSRTVVWSSTVQGTPKTLISTANACTPFQFYGDGTWLWSY
jgi:hypothetical protein